MSSRRICVRDGCAERFDRVPRNKVFCSLRCRQIEANWRAVWSPCAACGVPVTFLNRLHEEGSDFCDQSGLHRCLYESLGSRKNVGRFLADVRAGRTTWDSLVPVERERERGIAMPTTETCPATGEEVVPCDCGPHLECPEHSLNCLLNAEEDGAMPSNAELKARWPELTEPERHDEVQAIKAQGDGTWDELPPEVQAYAVPFED